MDAKELRLGNLIEHKGEVHTVKELHLFKVSTSWFDIEYDLCKGIPLTPEWLEMFGFQFDEDKGFEGRPHWYCLFYRGMSQIRFCVYMDELTCYVSLPCQTVHQLQNAYYCVTGQELELKP